VLWISAVASPPIRHRLAASVAKLVLLRVGICQASFFKRTSFHPSRLQSEAEVVRSLPSRRRPQPQQLCGGALEPLLVLGLRV
jgi:hypothetical protein